MSYPIYVVSSFYDDGDCVPDIHTSPVAFVNRGDAFIHANIIMSVHIQECVNNGTVTPTAGALALKNGFTDDSVSRVDFMRVCILIDTMDLHFDTL
jgi:hypothetical protein